jgi:hypothetical protein
MPIIRTKVSILALRADRCLHNLAILGSFSCVLIVIRSFPRLSFQGAASEINKLNNFGFISFFV